MKSLLLKVSCSVVLFGLASCGEKKDTEGGATPNPPKEAGEGTKSGNRTSAAPPAKGDPTPKAQPERAAKSQHLVIVSEFGDQMDAFGAALASVSDLASVAQAKVALEEVERNMRTIASQLETMTPPSNEERRRLSEMMQEREKALEDTLGSQEDFMANLDPDVREALQEAMSGFISAMSEINPLIETHLEPDAEPPVEIDFLEDPPLDGDSQ